MTREELKQDLLAHFPECSAKGFDFEDNVNSGEPVVIIRSFCPSAQGKRYSFAFELDPILNSPNMTQKTWITIEPGDTKDINPCENYKQFLSGGESFYPYSVDFSKYSGTAKDIKNICCNIYHYNRKTQKDKTQ